MTATPKILHFGTTPEQEVKADAISVQIRSYPATGRESETIAIEVPYFFRGETFITKLVLDVPDALMIASQITKAVANKY